MKSKYKLSERLESYKVILDMVIEDVKAWEKDGCLTQSCYKSRPGASRYAIHGNLKVLRALLLAEMRELKGENQ